MIDNITVANQLNNDVNTKIEPIVWRIVAGKVSFEDSEIMPLIADIRERMTTIRKHTDSVEASGIMEVSLRALDTLEDYLIKLEDQIEKREPVEENEKILEEIRLCVSGINDLLQEFSSIQVMEVDILNKEVTAQSNESFVTNIVLALLVVTVGILAFWYIGQVITGPINKLLKMSNRISKGDFSSRLELSASREFNELALSMNSMQERIELLIEKSIEEEKQLQMLEYRSHQAQISPHFLYNTLDAIIWAAEEKDTDKVITIVSALSSFFRKSLSHGVDFISIADEIEHIQNYLAIQKIRYSDVLSYEINVNDGLKDQQMLKFLLQPLVENSLYHGIKGTRGRGQVTVDVEIIDDKVRFSVKDNGIGMTREKLKSLKKELHNNSSDRKSYGLYSVNRRLELYYGIKEGIKIKSVYKEGTEVSFSLDIL